MKYTLTTTALALLLGGGCSEKESDSPDVSGTSSREISVTNLEEFLEGLVTAQQSPGTTLTLSPGSYDVSVRPELPGSTAGLSWNTAIPGRALGSGAALVIIEAKALTIRSADPDHPAEIVSSNPGAKVLGFYRGDGIRLENLISGHSPPANACMGAVWTFSECKNITISDADLYGCGTHGLQLFKVHGFGLNGGVIRECSQGGIEVIMSSDVTIRNLDLLNNDIMTYARPSGTYNWTLVNVGGSKNVRLTGCKFEGNRATTAIQVTETAQGWSDVAGFDTPGTPLIVESCDLGDQSQYEAVTRDEEWVRFE